LLKSGSLHKCDFKLIVMSGKELFEIASGYMQIWSSGNENLLDQYAADDLQVFYTHFPKPINPSAAYKEMLKQTYGFFPDITISIDEIEIAENQMDVFVSWTYQGKHTHGKLFGVEPSDRKVKVSGMTRLQIENGKVVSEKGIVDNLSLLFQLGALKTA
jgi:steroid delta-isomerase-like uncharacterized protein